MKSAVKYKKGLVKHFGLTVGLILSANSAQSADLIPQFDCSGSIKVLKTSEALGEGDSYGNYDVLIPGYVSFKAEVEFAPISADCENVVKQLGIKPYASSMMMFQGQLAKGSSEIAQLLAEEIVGQTLSYQFVVKADELGPNFPSKIVAAKASPEVKFVGSSELGPIALSSFNGQKIVFSAAHAPKALNSLSDADKLADASLIFNAPEFLAGITYKIAPLAKFLKTTLMPEDTSTQKAYLDLIASALLSKIEANEQYAVLSLAGNHSIYVGQLISKLASAPEVMTSEEKAQLLLTFPGLLKFYDSCVAEDAEVMLSFLKKAQDFQAVWQNHVDNMKEILEDIVEGKTYCSMQKPTAEMKALAASALEKI